jgi:hypothetical protein
MIMRSLSLLILLIPRHLLKLIPPFHLQTRPVSLAFIYPLVTIQIPHRRLYIPPSIPPPTRRLLPRRLLLPTASRPIPTSSYPPKRNTNPSPKGPSGYWRNTREVPHRAQNRRQSTQQLTNTQPEPSAIHTHQPLHCQATRSTRQEPSWQLPVASGEKPDA